MQEFQSAEYELAVQPPANDIHGTATPFLPPTAALATSHWPFHPTYSSLFSTSAAAGKPINPSFSLPFKIAPLCFTLLPSALVRLLKIHGQVTSIAQKVFQAFDAWLPKKNIAFTRSLGKKKLDKALIKSCQGSWDVKVGRTGDGLFYFEEGWKEFVKNHSLEVGEFLLFEHKGNMVFKVKVYEPRGCEKAFPPPSFRLIMAKTHRNNRCATATIPLDFARSTGLVDKSSMRVRDQSGKLWPMEIGTVKDREKTEGVWSRTYIKGKGWVEFYKANKLKDADVCIFELTRVPKSRSKPVIMNVKIFRFGS